MTYAAEAFAPIRGDLAKDVERITTIVGGLARIPSAFNRWRSTCKNECGQCPRCLTAKTVVAQEITKPDVLVWEVFDPKTLDPIGILRLSRIRLGKDALLDFSFFDGRISDKLDLLRQWVVDGAFQTQPDWTPLRRLNAEVPAHAFAMMNVLAKLGFVGKYRVRHGGSRFWADAIIPTQGHVGDLVIVHLDNEW